MIFVKSNLLLPKKKYPASVVAAREIKMATIRKWAHDFIGIDPTR